MFTCYLLLLAATLHRAQAEVAVQAQQLKAALTKDFLFQPMTYDGALGSSTSK